MVAQMITQKAIDRIPKDKKEYYESLNEQDQENINVLANEILKLNLRGLGEGGALELAIQMSKFMLAHKSIGLISKVKPEKIKLAINYFETEFKNEQARNVY